MTSAPGMTHDELLKQFRNLGFVHGEATVALRIWVRAKLQRQLNQAPLHRLCLSPQDRLIAGRLCDLGLMRLDANELHIVSTKN